VTLTPKVIFRHARDHGPVLHGDGRYGHGYWFTFRKIPRWSRISGQALRVGCDWSTRTPPRPRQRGL